MIFIENKSLKMDKMTLKLPSNDNIGNRIKFLIALVGVNQREFADIVGFEYRQMNNYLNKLKATPLKNPPANLTEALSKAEIPIGDKTYTVNMNFLTKGTGEALFEKKVVVVATEVKEEKGEYLTTVNTAPKTVQEALEMNTKAILNQTNVLIQIKDLLENNLKQKKE